MYSVCFGSPPGHLLSLPISNSSPFVSLLSLLVLVLFSVFQNLTKAVCVILSLELTTRALWYHQWVYN